MKIQKAIAAAAEVMIAMALSHFQKANITYTVND